MNLVLAIVYAATLRPVLELMADPTRNQLIALAIFAVCFIALFAAIVITVGFEQGAL